ncbi:HAD family hydrolase [Salinivibrio socompensis]|uniref:HAD family hydrolase n=1 Tax=Salinivibrio socompensis TaxID=1510206 RepID=UPI0004AF276E|nr:HAD family hydrolase [Salinivibrio socompensis]
MKNLFMLDVDGTLVDSCQMDHECFSQAIYAVTGLAVPDNWGSYTNVTDAGIIEELIDTHGLNHDKIKLFREIKRVFTQKLAIAITDQGVAPMPGAVEFIQKMRHVPSVELAIATGGWEETARMKLKAAGFHIDGIVFSSCSDAMSRSEVMALAAFRAKQDYGVHFDRRIYFGDGVLDKQASQSLNYEFVAVGDKVEHDVRVNHFANPQAILGKLGIEDVERQYA